ncbi:hypothetical protein MXAN_2131 [Myxococcus xanthus DK 1622]|uniref:Uncharacterized protein n=1 Tax=Myxococcus xanthus (strain DK1622) TaxID=246197 RepID=Q1DAG8_MYXXD|nr:hypothetical protein MXAN_2131 [Myxococcus xanthus DK 1622]
MDSAFPTRNGLCLSLVSGGFGAADERGGMARGRGTSARRRSR